MSLIVNLRHLEEQNVQLKGEMPVEELDIETRDEVIRLGKPLGYDLSLQKLRDGLLVQGILSLDLQCQCVRCLKRFIYRLELKNWTGHLPLAGEESVPVINDCVDLTPCLREDILLAFPQHPLCQPECPGLAVNDVRRAKNTSSTDESDHGSPAWNELNKLKF